MSSSSTSSDSNIYIATADSKDYLINPIDWNNITTHGVKDNSIPGSKIISIPVSKIVGDLPGGASKADVDAANLSSSDIISWQSKLGIDQLNTAISGKADKATTLAGYTIGDAYTKAEVDAKIGSSQTGLKFYKETGDVGSENSSATIDASAISLIGSVAINNSLTTNTITCSTIQNPTDKLTLSSPHSIDLYSDTGSVNITTAGTLGLSAGTDIRWTGNGSYINPAKLSAAESFEIYANNDIHINSDVGNVSIGGQTVSIYGNNSEINLSTSQVNFTGNASFPQDKFIEFHTTAGGTTTNYGTSASFSDDGGGNVTISSYQAKLWDLSTGNSLTLTPESIDIMDSSSTHTTIKPRVIQVGQNNWASTLGYAKLDISGDGIDDALNYDSISTTHSNIHRIKLPKGNIEDGTSFIIWVGTQAQYTALTTKDPSTMYFIIGTDGNVTTKFGV